MKNQNTLSYRICADPGEFCAGGLDRIYPDIQANIWPTIFQIADHYQWQDFKKTNSYRCWIQDNVLVQNDCVAAYQEPPNVINADLFFHSQIKYDQEIQNYINIIYQNRIINNNRNWPWGTNEVAGWIILLSKLNQFNHQ